MVKINEGNFQSGVTADIKFEENSPDGLIRITGKVNGLPKTNSSNKFGVHIHSHPYTDNECSTGSPQINLENTEHRDKKSFLGRGSLYGA